MLEEMDVTNLGEVGVGHIWGYGNREYDWVVGEMRCSGIKGAWRGAQVKGFKDILGMMSSAKEFGSCGTSTVWAGILKSCRS